MVIILDTDGFSGETYQGYLEQAVFTGLAGALPNDHFISTTTTGMPGLAPPAGVDRLPVQKGLFYRKKTEKWLRQQQADVFISFNKMLKTSHTVKQVLVIASEELLTHEKTIRLATTIGIVSPGLHRLFHEKYPDLQSKAILLNGIINLKTPVYKTADDIRETVASGREYFMLADFNLTREKLTTLLKGFSAFKRMLHSSWKLMVVLRSEETIRRADIEQLLSNYKYRDDVILTGADLLPEKLRDAYSLVSLDSSERLPIPVMEAASVNTPVIAPVTATLEQVFGDAVVYPENDTSEAIGKALMKLYKDENFRKVQKKRLNDYTSTLVGDDAASALARLLQIEPKE